VAGVVGWRLGKVQWEVGNPFRELVWAEEGLRWELTVEGRVTAMAAAVASSGATQRAELSFIGEQGGRGEGGGAGARSTGRERSSVSHGLAS
jgi:hypothetical protein